MRGRLFLSVTWLGLCGSGFIQGAQTPAPDPLRVEPDSADWNLDEVGLYRVGFAYRGQPEETFPVGWTGEFDERTGVSLIADGMRNGRPAVLQHCPWRGGTGVTFQEFHVRLPQARRIVLKGAASLRVDGVGKSDGVRFRVTVDGRSVFDELRTDAVWKDFQADLTASAGRDVVVRFETDPGPKGNSSFDFGLWSGRSIALEGFQPKAVARPASPPPPLRALVSRAGKGLAPPAPGPVKVEVAREGDGFRLRSSDAVGTFAYLWSPPTKDSGDFGTIVLEADRSGEPPVRVPVAQGAKLRWTSPAEAGASRWEESPAAATLVREFQVDGRPVSVRVQASIAGRSLALDVSVDQPVVDRIEGGGWGPVPARRGVPVPYYDGRIDYLPVEDLFVGAFADWTVSNGSRIDGTRAEYAALTDGSRNLPTERFFYSAAWNVDETLPNIPFPASPHIQDLADRVILDIWGGRYAEIAQKLEALHGAGLRRLVVIIHDWQRSGYDNALPAHFPAAENKGGEAGMKTLRETTARLGYQLALHENYVDYYPNYENFDEKHIAVDSAGAKVKAWFHRGNQIQSFAIKPTVMLDLAKTQSPEIQRRYHSDASFLDVNSSVPPWFHVDQQAGLEGAGTFQRVRQAHHETWNFLRETHQGPVYGEGNHHWYWSGLLDGVEAQFGSGWPQNAGREAPLFVDFDLVKIHPLQLNHGMGYYDRWWASDGLRRRGSATVGVLDQYRMQEIAFGHAGFLGASAWSSIPLAWLEYNLTSAVISRTAGAAAIDIQYERDGRWRDASTVIREGANSPDAWNRVRVRYDGGLTVIANQSAEPLKIDGLVLPRYGWIARAPGFTAGTTQREGVTVDLVDGPDRFFANARSSVDWDVAGATRVRPGVVDFRQTRPRAFTGTYRWKVTGKVADDYRAFVHFGKVGGDDRQILFQQDHAMKIPTNQWRPGSNVDDGPYEIRLPDGLPDGDYAWTIGLHQPGGGRATLQGPTDGVGRNLLGVVHVADAGRSIRFTPQKPEEADAVNEDDEALNLKGEIVDFGPLKTDGGVSIRKIEGDWQAHVVPHDRAFTLQLDAERFGNPTVIQAEGGATATVAPIVEGRWFRIPLNGAKSYRWPAK